MRRAFTLIEIIVVIGIVGILIGILLPALVRVKEQGSGVVSLVNLHSLGQTMAAFHAENNDYYPYYEPSSEIYLFPEHPDWTIANDGVWFMRTHWPTITEWRGMAPWADHYESWLSPGAYIDEKGPWYLQESDGWSWRPPSYHYSNSFIGDPTLWSDSPPPFLESAMKHRASDVRYPSAKVVMWDDERAYLLPAPTHEDPTPVLFADSSASLRKDTEAATPVRNYEYFLPHVYNDTPNGVLGRDF